MGKLVAHNHSTWVRFPPDALGRVNDELKHLNQTLTEKGDSKLNLCRDAQTTEGQFQDVAARCLALTTYGVQGPLRLGDEVA